MDRLSALDASFLYLEGPRTPMHVSSLAVYEGPAPSNEEFRDMLGHRLPLVPRFRRRLATVPFSGHRPVWIDDEGFDLDAHLQRVALGDPSETALMQLAGRLFSAPLCRTRPMWEIWLITGLERDRFAVLAKTHHSMWDGISGVDLHSVLLDHSPDARASEDAEPFAPEPEPSGLGLLFEAVRDRVREGTSLARTLGGAARDPVATARSVAKIARDATSFAASLIRPAPASPLNARTGSRRRYTVARASLHEIKDMRHTLGVSVNDVILAGVAGALRQWQLHRGGEPQDLRVLVPVSVRSDGDVLGNRVVMVVVDLPVGGRSAIERLERVHRTMEAAKRSGHIAAAETIARLSAYLPPTAIAAMSRAQAVRSPFNLLVTNIPGPQMPLYLLGRKLVELYPQAPLAANQGLSIAALSYNGKVGFGLLADYDNVRDVDLIARALEASLDDLAWSGGLDEVAVPSEPSIAQIAELTSIPF